MARWRSGRLNRRRPRVSPKMFLVVLNCRTIQVFTKKRLMSKLQQRYLCSVETFAVSGSMICRCHGKISIRYILRSFSSCISTVNLGLLRVLGALLSTLLWLSEGTFARPLPDNSGIMIFSAMLSIGQSTSVRPDRKSVT